MNEEGTPISPAELVVFGDFTLSAAERCLLRGEAVVPIGSRALDILIALLGRPGEVIGKRELLAEVWRGVTVDEGALRVHVAGLRKALRDGAEGARYIANVPGRGYAFVAPVQRFIAASSPMTTRFTAATELPPTLSRMVGRDEESEAIASELLAARFVSVVGGGGVGKTTVAVRAAHTAQSVLQGPVAFIDLSVISDPALVNQTIASMLGVNISARDAATAIVQFLGGRRCMLVLDSCEHLTGPVSSLLERLFREAPRVHLLTTTREPLRADGEHVFRLASLDCPPLGSMPNAAACLAHSAVQLFVERVAAGVAGFTLQDEHAAGVADICRKLDGIPLALELGAGCVEAFGLAGTASLLERHLELPWSGLRTAPQRQRTLSATLDWSYELLTQVEQTVFARLGIFNGPFDLEAAERIVADASIGALDVIGTLPRLVAKSLINPLQGSDPPRYRLLDTTRTYARTKLVASGEQQAVGRRHAQYQSDTLRMVDPTGLPAVSFVEQLPDVRAALEWCFFQGGDASVGVSLAAAAATPLLELSLCEECHRWTELAIAHLTADQGGGALELELQASLGWSAMFSAGHGDAVHGAFVRGLEIVEDAPDPHQQLRLLNGLSFVLLRKSDFIGGLDLAEEAAAIARATADPSLVMLAEWALGVCNHLCGHQDQVERYCASALDRPLTSPYSRAVAEYGYDYRGRALIARARALWLRGYPDQAASAAKFAIETAEEVGHPLSLLVVLNYASTVYIWCGMWEAAEATIDQLIVRSHAGSLIYREVGEALRAMLACLRAPDERAVEEFARCLDTLVAEKHLILLPMFRATLAEALVAHGRAETALQIIEEAIGVVGPEFASTEGPELLRVRGVVEAALGDLVGARAYLERALQLADRQAARSWRLRIFLSLAQLDAGANQRLAIRGLSETYDEFSEGLNSHDLRSVREFLARRSPLLVGVPSSKVPS